MVISWVTPTYHSFLKDKMTLIWHLLTVRHSWMIMNNWIRFINVLLLYLLSNWQFDINLKHTTGDWLCNTETISLNFIIYDQMKINIFKTVKRILILFCLTLNKLYMKKDCSLISWVWRTRKLTFSDPNCLGMLVNLFYIRRIGQDGTQQDRIGQDRTG